MVKVTHLTPVEHPEGTRFNGAGPSTIFRTYGAGGVNMGHSEKYKE